MNPPNAQKNNQGKIDRRASVAADVSDMVGSAASTVHTSASEARTSRLVKAARNTLRL